jgi:putative restriction endonuclease
MFSAEQWLVRLARLKVDRAKGDPAPHKPLLLLVVLELAEAGSLPDVLPLSPELAFRFAAFWRIVAARRTQRPDIRLPFHHLGTDGVWSPLDEGGRPSPHRDQTRAVALSADVLALLRDPVVRERSRRLLISKYFRPEERAALYELAGVPIPDEDQIARDAQVTDPAATSQCGREVRFRLVVVAAYDYTCALTGHRLLTVTAGSIVDAAHIHRFADSRNNDPRNGLALCKNAHWLFDQGLWTVSDDYRVQVALGAFAENCPDGTPLRAYHNRPLRVPSETCFRPHPNYLAWHRKHQFAG